MPEDSLFEFPCQFPIKVMGTNTEGFSLSVLEIVTRHAPDFNIERAEKRVSSSGSYLSITCTFQANSKTQLDELYRELSAHPAVKFVL